MSRALVEARGLSKRFTSRAGVWTSATSVVRAVDRVSLDVRPGETVGLVGESGSGKSTLGRLLIRLIEPDDGTIRFDGCDLLSLDGAELRGRRREFQMIFQDSHGSLNPRMRVGYAVGEPLTIHRLVRNRAERHQRVAALFEQVGLDPAMMRKYPHEFSGGQRQRIGIARAIACSPRFVVADEPVSALDPPVQAQIINLMVDLQERMGLAYLFIAHDLSLVQHVCDRVAVMYLGRIVEEASAASLYTDARHPYTRALLASTPSGKPGQPPPPPMSGEPPSATRPPAGCVFHPRCPEARPECAREEPPLLDDGRAHKVACHLVNPPTE